MPKFGVFRQLTQRGSRLLALAWMGMIFVLSSQPRVPMPELVVSQDKVMHLVAYAVLGLLLAKGWPPRTGRDYLSIAIAASGYGLLDEFHQSFVPGRFASIYDWIADSAGVFLGLWWYRYQAAREAKLTQQETGEQDDESVEKH